MNPELSPDLSVSLCPLPMTRAALTEIVERYTDPRSHPAMLARHVIADRDRLLHVLARAWSTEPVATAKTLPMEDLIVDAVCAEWKISYRAILMMKGRLKEVSEPRNVIIYLLRTVAECTFPKIGVLLERHHTSIMTGYRKMSARLRANHGRPSPNDHVFVGKYTRVRARLDPLAPLVVDDRRGSAVVELPNDVIDAVAALILCAFVEGASLGMPKLDETKTHNLDLDPKIVADVWNQATEADPVKTRCRAAAKAMLEERAATGAQMWKTLLETPR